jgi:hypothetical protein
LRGFDKAGVVQAIRDAGGEVYAITSEPQSLAYDAQVDWETGLEHVGDPHHEIADACTERGWLTLFTHHWGDDMIPSGASWMSHPKGYFQPGVLALSRTGRVLYRWRSRPSRSNVGGAVGRPTPEHVWRRLQAALEEPADAPDVAPDTDPELDTPPVPWPLFVMLLMANGWFLRPAAFEHRPGKDTVLQRLRTAQIRLAAFVAAWIAAALLLPGWLVGLAFVGWLAFAGVPGIRLVHTRFQSVAPDAEPT